jgi:hypothetical protein
MPVSHLHKRLARGLWIFGRFLGLWVAGPQVVLNFCGAAAVNADRYFMLESN